MRRRPGLRTAPHTLALAAAAAVFLLPQLWLLALSLKSKAGVSEYPPRWISAGASLANYRFVLTQTQVPWYLWNSARVAMLATALTNGTTVYGTGALSQSTGCCARDRARRAVGVQRRKPARDLAGEARIGMQIVAEDRA